MRKYLFSILIAINFLTAITYSQTTLNETSLNFSVTGFESNIGQALLELYRKEDKVPKSPFMILKSVIVNKEASFTLRNLDYADYAVIIVHDQNSNGIIDHNWGIPSEPLGFTNNWKLSLFSGMPSFKKLKFTFSKSNNIIKIEMNK